MALTLSLRRRKRKDLLLHFFSARTSPPLRAVILNVVKDLRLLFGGSKWHYFRMRDDSRTILDIRSYFQ